MLAKSAHTLSVCLNADSCRIRTLLTALSKKFKVRYYARVSLLTVIHQEDNPPQPLLQQKTILLAQQREGIYQAVFQHEERVYKRTGDML